MALRQTEILKHDWIGPQKQPVAIITTYRTRKVAKGGAFTYRTVILSGTHDCLILDWMDEEGALEGHGQTLAKVQQGYPVHLIVTH